MITESHDPSEPNELDTPPVDSIGRSFADTAVIVALAKILNQKMCIAEIKFVIEELTIDSVNRFEYEFTKEPRFEGDSELDRVVVHCEFVKRLRSLKRLLDNRLNEQ